jgi:hypothetical protein
MKRLLATIVCFAFFLSPALAKQKVKISNESEPKVTAAASGKESSNKWLDVEIIPSDREKIRQYYQKEKQKAVEEKKDKKKKSLPPGLKKKVARGGELPPGWQKKIARGEVLDADIYNQSEKIPYEVIKVLEKQPEDTELIKVEGKVIRILKATRSILDEFDLAN